MLNTLHGMEAEMTTILEQYDTGKIDELATELNALAEKYGHPQTARRTKHDGKVTVYHRFVGDRDRLKYDFNLCPRSEGWRQFDTDQDAWYFGIWYNPERRVVVTYAEGDETIVVCETNEAWKAELQEMAAFYGDPPAALIGIDLNGQVTYYFDEEARPKL